jgi:hypothetical protein
MPIHGRDGAHIIIAFPWPAAPSYKILIDAGTISLTKSPREQHRNRSKPARAQATACAQR